MSWSLEQVTAPTDMVVSLEEAKLHLRVDHDDEDSLIEQIIKATTERAELFQLRAYAQQTFRLTLPRFPNGRTILLPRPPLQSVESIEYTDADGASQTLSSDRYRVDTASEPGRVILIYDDEWPDTRNDPDAVKIEYTAGYADVADVPATRRAAILLLIGHLYENRETVTVGSGPTFQIPMGPEYLLSPERVFARDPLDGA